MDTVQQIEAQLVMRHYDGSSVPVEEEFGAGVAEFSLFMHLIWRCVSL